jgi:hypothetical protein
MTNVDIEHLREKLLSLGLATDSTIQGLSPAEIEAVAAAQGDLPGSYARFLAAMGRQAGHLMRGTDLYFPRILKAREWAVDLLRESGQPFQLESDDVVFALHQGYVMYFFRQRGDDPEVWEYAEGESAPVPSGKGLAAFLEATAEAEADIIRSIPPEMYRTITGTDRPIRP